MHPSFIRGFVKQCYDRGLSEDQAEAALRAWGLREQLEDPDFRVGFDKQAGALQSILAKGKDLANKGLTAFNSLPSAGRGALVGGLAGAAGGALFGGKRRMRNALIAALGGAGLGALGGSKFPQHVPGGNLALSSSPSAQVPEATKPTSAPTQAVRTPDAKPALSPELEIARGGAIGATGGGAVAALLPYLIKNPVARRVLDAGKPLARIGKGALLGGAVGAAVPSYTGTQPVPTPVGEVADKGTSIPSQPL